MTRRTASDIIKAELLKSGEDPQEINNGGCQDFAEFVVEQLTESGDLHGLAVDMEWFDEIAGAERDLGELYDDGFPWHVWVYHRGRHYDAEAPDGVEDWKDLPFWRRWAVKRSDLFPPRMPDERLRLDQSAAFCAGVRERIAKEAVGPS